LSDSGSACLRGVRLRQVRYQSPLGHYKHVATAVQPVVNRAHAHAHRSIRPEPAHGSGLPLLLGWLRWYLHRLGPAAECLEVLR
jgi:hypothetical protein